MSIIKISLLLLCLAICTNVTANKPKGNHGRGGNGLHGHGGNGSGAPLDGGLITLLGAGGIAYYIAKKRGEKLDS